MRITSKILATFIALFLPAFAAAMPELELKPYEFKTNNGEVVQAELGELKVPELRSRKDSKTITLRFIRFKSTSKTPGAPIIYLAGGPGASGIGAARGPRFALFQAMREFGDVIALDQRGIGMSDPDLSCTEKYVIPEDRELEPVTAGKILAEAAGKCFERLKSQGHDLRGYNSLESAADINDLRIALGASKVSLWGISYGTHLSLAFMKQYGSVVDRAILAGVEPLYHTLKLPSDQEKLMNQISSLAKKDPEVRKALPDMYASTKSLIERLSKEPQTIPLVNPFDGTAFNIKAGAFDLQVVLASMLTGPDSFATMPDLIFRMERGDWTALGLLAAANRMFPLPTAMTIATDCASGASSDWIEKIRTEAAGTLLADAINFPFLQICDSIGIDPLPDSFRQPVKLDAPVLLISGTLDGRTPPENAAAAAKYLPNSQHLIIKNAGHSDPLFLSSPKILEAMKAFMQNNPIAELHIEAAPVNFVPPRNVIQLPAEVLKRYTGSYKIRDNQIRKVIAAGSVLYTRRGEGPILAARPMSETDFFYEGSAAWIRFELDENKNPVAMTVFQAGSTQSDRAPKIVDEKAESNSAQIEKAVDEYLQPYLKAGFFSGSILIARKGEVLLKKGYGSANLEFDVPNAPDTRFHIASVSKAFTSAAIMILKEEKLLALTDPISKYIPEFRNGHKIQIHHLLTHTSGIPNVNELPEYEDKSKFHQDLQSIISWANGMPLEFQPGEKFNYSNTNYNLLAAIIEKVSGKSYGEFLKQRMFDPIQMTSTGHDSDPSVIIPKSASGYVPIWINEIQKAPYLDWSIKTGNGSLYSTVEDLYRWNLALMNGKIVSQTSIDEMIENRYGWFTGERFGKRRIYMNGRSPGFCSYVESYIDDDAFIAVLANQYTAVAHAIIPDLAAILFGEKYEIPKQFTEAPAAKLQKLEGTYEFGTDFYNPGKYDLRVLNGRLSVIREDFSAPLIPLSESEFFLLSFWARIRFVLNEDGSPAEIIYDDGQQQFRAVKVSK